MTYDEIRDVLSLVPELEIWDVDVDTLDATIVISRNVGGKRLYVKNVIPHEELSSAADPVEYIKGILRRMRVMINNRH